MTLRFCREYNELIILPMLGVAAKYNLEKSLIMMIVVIIRISFAYFLGPLT